jgi:MFS superfamily sulfate permease-like transporter
MEVDARQVSPRNRFDRMEWAGALGDLGTLIPFVAAYLAVVRIDSFGVLFAFGVAMIATGWHYRTPVPVQPMKALGAIASVQAAQGVVGPAAVHAAALVTGLVWLLLGASGWLSRMLRWIAPAVVIGIVLGLGLGFVFQGLRLMHQDWIIAGAAGLLAIALMRSRVFPAMFALLLLGAGVGAWRQPQLLANLLAAPVELRWPRLTLQAVDGQALLAGAVLLALPQMPLTLGNAILALREENNRRFPDRPLDEREAAVSTGLMNVLGGLVGGVPMCHGAGGMAAHAAFGARTGGAVIIVGALMLALALFFSAGVEHLFRLFAAPVLGVMLAITGAQLARGAAWPAGRDERLVVLACAALSLWNVAVAFGAGIVLHAILRRLVPDPR